jgi:hypothetical protein
VDRRAGMRQRGLIHSCSKYRAEPIGAGANFRLQIGSRFGSARLASSPLGRNHIGEYAIFNGKGSLVN